MHQKAIKKHNGINIKKCCLCAGKACLYALISLAAYLFLALVLSGCAPTPTVIEKPVPYLVPTKCSINLPNRPEWTGDIVADIKGMAIYTEKCEAVAIECGAIK